MADGDPEDPAVKALQAKAAQLDEQMAWLHETEVRLAEWPTTFSESVRSQGCAGRLQPINVYDEMDWIANRSRAELRATLEQIIRQERDNLVMKLNRCGSLSRPQSQHSPSYSAHGGCFGLAVLCSATAARWPSEPRCLEYITVI